MAQFHISKDPPKKKAFADDPLMATETKTLLSLSLPYSKS